MTPYKEGIRTVGELKAWLKANEIADDTPIWTGATVDEWSCTYQEGYRHYDVNVLVATETFGLWLQERQKTETGVVFW